MPGNATAARERELKFSPGALFQLPDLNAIEGVHAGDPETIRLQAVYFDTDDLALRRAGCTLRIRVDDSTATAVVTWKGPAKRRGKNHKRRPEVELPVESVPDTGEELTQLLAKRSVGEIVDVVAFQRADQVRDGRDNCVGDQRRCRRGSQPLGDPLPDMRLSQLGEQDLAVGLRRQVVHQRVYVLLLLAQVPFHCFKVRHVELLSVKSATVPALESSARI